MKIYGQDEFTVLFSRMKILEQVEAIAKRIKTNFSNQSDGRPILLICVLNGAMYFFVELTKMLSDKDILIDTIGLSSYRNGVDSAQIITIVKKLDIDPRGYHVLVVEDIIDTGLTIQFLRNLLVEAGAASVQFCCLLDKRPRRMVQVDIQYVGFVMENDEFVVGYGLDYNGRYRNLPYIAALHPRMYKK
ncbi:MAG: hypoxanthine phosphoribosyltransferase [Parcubacteria group bacterium RIFCSPHIGHO2_01_FULL_47_10b]|nr:MAG: hypoxanthine phosphoribosyltransferase [Parcubacteria group bacterium RIFCSPHIGHO2_01_FULL_47_10b]